MKNILEIIKGVIKKILGSKKAMTTIVSIISLALTQKFGQATTAQIMPYIGIIVSYLLGQGLADFGKEANNNVTK